MGSYCGIYFDELSICDAKSMVPDTFAALFQEDDRVEEPDPDADDEDEVDSRIRYRVSRQTMLQRLSLLGVTEDIARDVFDRWLASELETWNSYVAEADGEWAKDTADALALLNYEEWRQHVPAVLVTRYDFSEPAREPVDEIDRRMRDHNENWMWFAGYGSHVTLRALLDACPQVEAVSLDISSLVHGGYIEANEAVCEEARAREPYVIQPLAPTMVLAEGSTDIAILKRSLHAMHPELKDYFSFFNHAELSVDGGTAYLIKFLKAFAAARASFRMIAIFDNDTIGVQAYEQARTLALPPNMIVMRLPDCSMAKQYPTVGPQGRHELNVNGQAAGIELYLGEPALSIAGALRPVRWTGYVQSAKAYQGEVEGKAKILASFFGQLEATHSAEEARSKFPDLALVWENIIRRVEEAAGTAIRQAWDRMPVES